MNHLYNKIKENKIIVYFLISIIFFVIYYSNYPESLLNKNIEGGNEIDNKDNNDCEIDSKSYYGFNNYTFVKETLKPSHLMLYSRGFNKTLLYSDNDLFNDNYYIGINPFKNSLLNENVYIEVSSIWSLILSDLSYNIKLKDIGIQNFDYSFRDTIDIYDSLINNSSISLKEKENVLMQKLSFYIKSSFLPLIFPNFTGTPSKDALVYMGQLLGGSSYDFENIKNHRNSFKVELSKRHLGIIGTEEDILEIKNQIHAIYDFLDDFINKSSSLSEEEKLKNSIDLFKWYKTNTYHINQLLSSFLKSDNNQMALSMNEYYEYLLSGSYFNNILFGYKTLNFKILKRNELSGEWEGTPAILYTGHFGVSLNYQKHFDSDSMIMTPNQNWLLTSF